MIGWMPEANAGDTGSTIHQTQKRLRPQLSLSIEIKPALEFCQHIPAKIIISCPPLPSYRFCSSRTRRLPLRETSVTASFP